MVLPSPIWWELWSNRSLPLPISSPGLFRDSLLCHMVPSLIFFPSSLILGLLLQLKWTFISSLSQYKASTVALLYIALNIFQTPPCMLHDPFMSSKQYHLCDSCTLPSLATSKRYPLGPFGLIFCVLALSKHFLQDCTSVMLVSITVLQPRWPVSIDPWLKVSFQKIRNLDIPTDSSGPAEQNHTFLIQNI